MILLIEDKLNYIKYADNNVVIKKTKLGLELHSDKWNMPLPSSWDYEIIDEPSNAKIFVQDAEPPFIVEGSDDLFYVSSRDSISSVTKDVLFFEAIKHAIGEDIITMANLNGYDTSENKRNERIFNVAAIILNYANKDEDCVFRIPYLLDPNYDIVRENPDYNAIPEYYQIDKSRCTEIVDELTTSIKKYIRFDNKDAIVTLYSYNWFISKIQLS